MLRMLYVSVSAWFFILADDGRVSGLPEIPVRLDNLGLLILLREREGERESVCVFEDVSM